MLDGLNAEQEAFCEAIAAFGATADADLSERLAAGGDEALPRSLWHRAAAVGLTGLIVDEQHGGQGADPLTAAAALEMLGFACRDNGLLFSLGAHLWSAAAPIERFGTAEQQQRFLPGMCDGSIIGVQAMTEPEAGSDAFSLRTLARDDGDDVVLTGSKTFITNAPIADVLVVFATTDPAKGWAGLSAYLVERDTPGLSVGAPMEKMGLRTSPTAEVFFDDARVPVTQRLGPRGGGMAVFLHAMEWERAFILAPAVGTMRRQVRDAVAYASTREQFGAPIGSFQAVSHRIADMHVRQEAASALLGRLARRRAAGERTDVDAAVLKLFVSEAWVASGLDAIQVHGGAGYLTDTGVERDLRDALAGRIYSGTSEIQRNLIARSLGLP